MELKGRTSPVYSVAFSPDGTRIVTGGGEFNKAGEVKVWERGAALPLELKGHTNMVRNVSFSADGNRIVTDGYDETKVWDRGRAWN